MPALHCALPAIGILAAALLTSITGGGQMATSDRLDGPGWWPTKGIPLRDDYIGAAACGACHAAQFATQPATSMAWTAAHAESFGRPARPDPGWHSPSNRTFTRLLRRRGHEGESRRDRRPRLRVCRWP